MDNNFRRMKFWIVTGVITFIILLGLQELYYETSLVDWFDSDDFMWLFVVYAFNIAFEAIIGCARMAINKVKNLIEGKES